MVETAAVVAVIMGLVEVLKRGLKMDAEKAPLVAVVLGVLLALYFDGMTSESVFMGIVNGLTASGLWSLGGKSVVKAVLK